MELKFKSMPIIGKSNLSYLTNEEGELLLHYNAPIAFKKRDGEVILNEGYYNYSTTTSKHRNQFLGVESSVFNKKLKRGDFKIEAITIKVI